MNLAVSGKNSGPRKSSGAAQRRQTTRKGASADHVSDAPLSRPRRSFQLSLAAGLGLAFVLALSLRVVNCLETAAVPTVTQLVGDARGYVDWGNQIYAGNWYGDQTFYQAPAYPYFLASVFTILGPNIAMVRLVQALLGAVGAILAGHAVSRFLGRRVGIASAFLLAVYPAAIYYDGLIQKAGLASFLLCLLLAGAAEISHRKSAGAAIASGLSLGLLVLTRENALLWIPLIPLWILVFFRELGWRQRVQLTGCFVAGLALILVPVAARNASLGGEWSPTTFQSGPNFYIGNNSQANGVYSPLVPGHETPKYERTDAQNLAESAKGRALSSREVSRYWMQRAISEIWASPVEWMKLMGTKILLTINRFEVPDVDSIHVHRQWSQVLKIPSVLLHFGVLCPVAVVGFLLGRTRRRLSTLYLVLFVTMVGAVALFFVLGRYRNPLVPLLVPYAAFAVVRWRGLLRLRTAQKLQIVLATVFVAVICNVPVCDENGLNASAEMNCGISAAKNEDYATAIEWLELSLTHRPANGVGFYNLGAAYAFSGRTGDAITAFLRAKDLEPGLDNLDLLIAQLYERSGNSLEAAKHYALANAKAPN